MPPDLAAPNQAQSCRCNNPKESIAPYGKREKFRVLSTAALFHRAIRGYNLQPFHIANHRRGAKTMPVRIGGKSAAKAHPVSAALFLPNSPTHIFFLQCGVTLN